MYKKIVSSIVLSSIFLSFFTPIITYADPTNGLASPWTQEKAAHLARKALFGPTQEGIQALFDAGSASAAVDVLFPSLEGPDRSAYDQALSDLSNGVNISNGSAFDPTSSRSMYEYYVSKKLLDPYEAKQKLFLIFEDTFAVNRSGDISYLDIENTHDILYSHTLGNYREMLKRNLYNNGQPGDYALGEFLDLFNQSNPSRPNENYSREMLQLLMMYEYIPTTPEGNPDDRNYSEDDVHTFAQILFGFEADENTHAVTFNADSNTNESLLFLTGALNSGDSFPFYNAETGEIDVQLLKNPIDGNNGLPDNIVDYIFSKRDTEIALFLADKLYRFYVAEQPTRSELDSIASNILSNNFELYPSVKNLLASDVMYSEKSMNGDIFKNPIELTIGLMKTTGQGQSDITNPYLSNDIGWRPYFPGSIFGRQGFEVNREFFTPYTNTRWSGAATSITNTDGFKDFIPTSQAITVTDGVFATLPSYIDSDNIQLRDLSFSGGLDVSGISLQNGTGTVSYSLGTLHFDTQSVETLVNSELIEASAEEEIVVLNTEVIAESDPIIVEVVEIETPTEVEEIIIEEEVIITEDVPATTEEETVEEIIVEEALVPEVIIEEEITEITEEITTPEDTEEIIVEELTVEDTTTGSGEVVTESEEPSNTGSVLEELTATVGSGSIDSSGQDVEQEVTQTGSATLEDVSESNTGSVIDDSLSDETDTIEVLSGTGTIDTQESEQTASAGTGETLEEVGDLSSTGALDTQSTTGTGSLGEIETEQESVEESNSGSTETSDTGTGALEVLSQTGSTVIEETPAVSSSSSSSSSGGSGSSSNNSPEDNENNTGSLFVEEDMGSILEEEDMGEVQEEEEATGTGSTETGTGSTDTSSGSLNSGTGSVMDEVVETSTGSLSPLDISSGTGSLTIYAATLDITQNKLLISSGSLAAGEDSVNISSGSIDLPSSYTLEKRISPYDLIGFFEENLYFTRTLPQDTRNAVLNYMLQDSDGAPHSDIDINNLTYYREHVLGAAQIMLMQPEYIMQTFEAQSIGAEPNYSPFYNSDSKLVIMQALGGTDWLHAVVPKYEYSEYLENRGVGALQVEDLTSLNDDYYIHNGLSSFKPLFDTGNLKIFNRVGTPFHSRGHDSAQRAMSSQQAKFEQGADGFIGGLIQNEDPIRTVALNGGTQSLEGGNYLQIGSNAYFQISHSVSSEHKQHRLDTLGDIYDSRPFSPAASGVFQNSVQVDAVSQNSLASGGRAGAGSNMQQNFTFAQEMFSAGSTNVITMRVDGGWDTHSNQKSRMETNFSTIGGYISDFFNTMQAENEDVTLVWYSEFGRTNNINSSDGTDHGQGGGMFVFTTNTALQARLSEDVYGNLSFKDSRSNWLGVGIDYRTVHKIILEELYGAELDTLFDLDDDIEDYTDTIAPQISLLREEFSRRNSSQSAVTVAFHIEDTNFRRSGASYVRFAHGTDPDNLIERSTSTIWRDYLSDEGAVIPFSGYVNQGETNYYQIIVYDDQYNQQVIDGSFVAPTIRPVGDFSIERNSDTRIRSYEDFVVNGENILPDPVVLATMSGAVTIEGENARIFAGTGTTIDSLQSNEIVNWSGIFKVPENIETDTFLDNTAQFNGRGLREFRIPKMIKVGGDVLGLRMNLNQSVGLELDIPDTSKDYIVLESEDGINWTLNTSAITKTDTSIGFSTDHFTFFALVEVDEEGNPVIPSEETPESEVLPETPAPVVVVTPDPVITTPNISTGGATGSSRRRIAQKDVCPQGDYSGNYYDSDCGVDPEAYISTANYDNPEMFGETFSSMRDEDASPSNNISDILKKPSSQNSNISYSSSQTQQIDQEINNGHQEGSDMQTGEQNMQGAENSPEEKKKKRYRSAPLENLYQDLLNADLTIEEQASYVMALDRVYDEILSLQSSDLSESESYAKKQAIKQAFIELESRILVSETSDANITEKTAQELTKAEKRALVQEKIRKRNAQRGQSGDSAVIPELTPKNIREDEVDQNSSDLSQEEKKKKIQEKIRAINKANQKQKVQEKIRQHNASLSEK